MKCGGCGNSYIGYHSCFRPAPTITVDQPIYLRAELPTDVKYVTYLLYLDRRNFRMMGRNEFACSRELVREIAHTMLALADKMDELEAGRKAGV